VRWSRLRGREEWVAGGGLGVEGGEAGGGLAPNNSPLGAGEIPRPELGRDCFLGHPARLIAARPPSPSSHAADLGVSCIFFVIAMLLSTVVQQGTIRRFREPSSPNSLAARRSPPRCSSATATPFAPVTEQVRELLQDCDLIPEYFDFVEKPRWQH